MKFVAHVVYVSRAEARALCAIASRDKRSRLHSVLFDRARGIAAATDGRRRIVLVSATVGSRSLRPVLVSADRLSRAAFSGETLVIYEDNSGVGVIETYSRVHGATGFTRLRRDQFGHGTDDRCCCRFCSPSANQSVDNPAGVWDTRATSLSDGETWKVHYPELHGRKPRRYA